MITCKLVVTRILGYEANRVEHILHSLVCRPINWVHINPYVLFQYSKKLYVQYSVAYITYDSPVGRGSSDVK